MTRVLVVGGYGAVGRHLCKELASDPSIKLVVAGRRLEAAEALAKDIGASARRIDLTEPVTWASACDGAELVVVCMDQQNTRFVSFILERGVHYIDITASDALFREIESVATPPGVGVLLSVGLAPGLTNILASFLANRMDRVDDIQIGLMGGLGDNHGRAGIAWMADRMFGANSLKQETLIDFGEKWGVRKARRLDFSDQHALMRTLRISTATTSVCLDSRIATELLFGTAQRIRSGGFLSRVIIWLIEHIRIGSKVCNIAVTANGERDGKRITEQAWFFASSESLTTALLAAVLIRRFLADPRPGIWHSHQLFSLESVSEEVLSRSIGCIVYRK
ncbi:saccharopine dehydrogenase NADP-binding domain-containing protein (plasmid) [Ensifer adhaerens]|uniref:saccharopine dehydrogenase NADP-binding domain-containing protein n=1 Tax=Ensifer adhaerens TaxID=106592 RepID=UPI0021007954|nr:saccharopine dehydrogenase NADP-binding domain-containing protein [Ensifer adhaerens]UTV41867.1 saccharopine dehydrogenase NADP-binding domain-containing protein [Ensifer adhaerens]